MESVAIALPQAPPVAYTATIASGSLAHAGESLRPLLADCTGVFLVTTPPVEALWGEAAVAGLATSGITPTMLVMPDGEPYKTISELEILADAMAAAGADRGAVVVALGGGMVGDVAALLASTYMRGVVLVHIPTTLVAMVDSSLGGKAAVNLAVGKNLFGTFHHPRAILVDPNVLSTLCNREFRSGMAEAIKYGIIGDRALFDFILSEADDLLDLEPRPLVHLIASCLRQKAAVVAADEREGGRRQILNFGHTLGHALEAATQYRIFLHGEAVAWGMMAATQLAQRLGRLAASEAEQIIAAIKNVTDPLPELDVPAELILRYAAADKKARAGVLTFVLPIAIGAVEIVRDVPVPLIREVWEQLRRETGQ